MSPLDLQWRSPWSWEQYRGGTIFPLVLMERSRVEQGLRIDKNRRDKLEVRADQNLHPNQSPRRIDWKN